MAVYSGSAVEFHLGAYKDFGIIREPRNARSRAWGRHRIRAEETTQTCAAHAFAHAACNSPPSPAPHSISPRQVCTQTHTHIDRPSSLLAVGLLHVLLLLLLSERQDAVQDAGVAEDLCGVAQQPAFNMRSLFAKSMLSWSDDQMLLTTSLITALVPYHDGRCTRFPEFLHMKHVLAWLM